MEVLLEKPGFLVVDKPPGLPVHGGDESDVLSVLAPRYPGESLAPVHRLDAETSGCLLVARTKPAFRFLARAFSSRKVEKSYLAAVAGRPADDAGEIFTHIASAGPGSPRMAVVAPGAGAAALTLFRILRRDANTSLLELRPITGRTHQIRVHLRHLGHPVLGDPLYAFPGAPPAPRLLLHAWRLAFPDPEGGEMIVCQSPPDEGFGEIPPAEAPSIALPVDPTGNRAGACPPSSHGERLPG